MSLATFTPRQPTSQWNKFDNARPYVGVMGIPFNRQGDVFAMYRSDKVRSAKNCWSYPSGLHEVGLYAPEQLLTELMEEFNLQASLEKTEFLTVYENIATEDNWHWTMLLYLVEVDSFENVVNKEPEKHPHFEYLSYHGFRTGSVSQRPWSNGLRDVMHDKKILNKIYHHIMERVQFRAVDFEDTVARV